MRQFTEADVRDDRIYVGDASYDLVFDPPEWMEQGLQETATGYGNRLNTGRKISFNGKLFRLYATCYSNVTSVYFTTRGRRIFVS